MKEKSLIVLYLIILMQHSSWESLWLFHCFFLEGKAFFLQNSVLSKDYSKVEEIWQKSNYTLYHVFPASQVLAIFENSEVFFILSLFHKTSHLPITEYPKSMKEMLFLLAHSWFRLGFSNKGTMSSILSFFLIISLIYKVYF